MTEKIRDFMRGSVKFNAAGGFTDEFLTACKNNGVILMNLQTKTNTVVAQTLPGGIRGIRKAALDTGMDVNILSQRGLYFMLLRLKNRWGIPVGLLLSLFLFCLLSCFVWSIQITVPPSLSELEIQKLLEENGVKKGCLLQNTDTGDIQNLIELSSPDISRADVNLLGSRLFITVYPREAVSKENTKQYCNIVAAKNGEIIHADIFAGEGNLPDGMPVARGDLLVSGTTELKNGGVRLVEAQAIVTARTDNTVSTSSALTVNAEKIVKKTDIYGVMLFYPLFKEAFGENRFSEVSYYLAGSATVQFPFGATRKRTTYYENTVVELTQKQAKLIALSDMLSEVQKQYSEAKILSRTTKIISENGVTLESRLICEEDIAKKQIFEVEDVQE